jgi:hypothetical protein
MSTSFIKFEPSTFELIGNVTCDILMMVEVYMVEFGETVINIANPEQIGRFLTLFESNLDTAQRAMQIFNRAVGSPMQDKYVGYSYGEEDISKGRVQISVNKPEVGTASRLSIELNVPEDELKLSYQFSMTREMMGDHTDAPGIIMTASQREGKSQLVSLSTYFHGFSPDKLEEMFEFIEHHGEPNPPVTAMSDTISHS